MASASLVLPRLGNPQNREVHSRKWYSSFGRQSVRTRKLSHVPLFFILEIRSVETSCRSSFISSTIARTRSPPAATGRLLSRLSPISIFNFRQRDSRTGADRCNVPPFRVSSAATCKIHEHARRTSISEHRVVPPNFLVPSQVCDTICDTVLSLYVLEFQARLRFYSTSLPLCVFRVVNPARLTRFQLVRLLFIPLSVASKGVVRGGEVQRFSACSFQQTDQPTGVWETRDTRVQRLAKVCGPIKNILRVFFAPAATSLMGSTRRSTGSRYIRSQLERGNLN